MKIALIYAVSLAAAMSLYRILAPAYATADAPILAMAQAQAKGQQLPAVPAPAQYQQQLAQLRAAMHQ